MFWIVLSLLFLGMIFFFLEVMLPFGVSFAGGLVLIGAAIYVAWRQDPEQGLFLLVISVPVSAIAAWWVFRSGFGLMNLRPDPMPAEADDDFPAAGTTVRVVQTLHPTGTVLWQGKRLAARGVNAEQEIPAGHDARVCGRDSIYALVEPLVIKAPTV